MTDHDKDTRESIETSEETESIDLSRVRMEGTADRYKGKRHTHHSHHRHHKHHRKQNHKKNSVKKVLLRVLFVLLILAGILAGGTAYLYHTGKGNLLHESTAPTLEPAGNAGTSDEIETLDQNEVIYQGTRYRYKDSLINILLIGVDSKGSTEDEPIQKGSTTGQADMLMLLSMDTKANTMTAIPINRDTMTMIAIRDQAGTDIGEEERQIALSHAFGKNNKDAAKLTVQAVSNLFHGLSIQRYVSVNISGIPVINDAVGGVEVTLPEDFVKEWGDAYRKGTKVLLRGSMAEDYVRARGSKVDPTNVARMGRQRAYLMSLAEKILRKTKSDLTFPVSVYKKLQPYMTTDLELNEVTYLASEGISCAFGNDSIRSIEGTMDYSGTYARFNVDEEKLYELMLQVFYDAEE